MKEIIREITPLNEEDLFIVLNTKKANFDYPIHFHPDFELNLVLNAEGERIVGDSIEKIADPDLILIGSNLPHKWQSSSTEAHVITIQFHEQLLGSFLLSKRMFAPIREMLERSGRGIDFSPETKERIIPRILKIDNSHGFVTALDFFTILYDLATSGEQKLLASSSYDTTGVIRESKSRRINLICQYIENNYNKNITLKDIAVLVNMSESAVSHFFKKRTNRSFVSYLNEVRISHAIKMLIETTHSVSEICYLCGYTNLSNFNRMFKKMKNQTPTEYREAFLNASSMTKF